jgi:dihydrofolate synthase/folylpolyglutamate synthase
MNFDLDRMKTVMQGLQNPQNQFRSIHVAGTNGKGSVCAMMATALECAGLKVGLYTSPHLERLHERFQINRQLISTAKLNDLTSRLRQSLKVLNPSFEPTQFEVLTALAFMWFAEEKVDVAVIETGLGGRLDATNVMSRVLVSVITTIDLDHTEWLGNSIKKIALEKAGIIKERVPVVTGTEEEEALRVIREAAQQKESPLTVVTPAEIKKYAQPPYHLQLKGKHQVKNAALAVKALTLISNIYPLDHEHIVSGVNKARWPGRFERFWISLPDKKTLVILDGAHNPAAILVLTDTLEQEGLTRLNLLFGALKDKDSARMARFLSPFVETCVTVPVPSIRTAQAGELARLPEWRGRAHAAPSIPVGWERIKKAENPHAVLVTGSLYLVGAVRRMLHQQGDQR